MGTEEEDFRSLVIYKIDELRHQHGLTWPELSRRSGIGVRTLTRLSKGKYTYIPIRALVTLMRVFGVRTFDRLVEIKTSHPLEHLAPKGDAQAAPRVVFYITSFPQDPVRGSIGGASEGVGISKERCGVWDIRAVAHMIREMFRQYGDIEPDIEVREYDDDPRRADEVARRLRQKAEKEGGTHVFIGSPLWNDSSEGVVCSSYHREPYVSTQESRAAFPYVFQWMRGSAPDSAFGRVVDDPAQAGIVDSSTGKLVARFELVGNGEGIDCALIMVERIADPEDPTRDHGMLIVLLGYGGPATFAAARIVVDPSYGHELYPSLSGVALMRAVKVTYKRRLRSPGDTRDTRQVVDFSLVPLCPDSRPPVRAAA